MIGKIAAVVALAAAALVVIPATSASARACTAGAECYTTWYSNAAHTTVVGWMHEACNGTITTWGTRSGYVTFSEISC